MGVRDGGDPVAGPGAASGEGNRGAGDFSTRLRRAALRRRFLLFPSTPSTSPTAVVLRRLTIFFFRVLHPPRSGAPFYGVTKGCDKSVCAPQHTDLYWYPYATMAVSERCLSRVPVALHCTVLHLNDHHKSRGLVGQGDCGVGAWYPTFSCPTYTRVTAVFFNIPQSQSP